MDQGNETTAYPAVMPSQPGCEHCTNSQQLKTLAENLESRGLNSRLITYASGEPNGERIEQVVVTNPAARERGEVRIGDDGYVTWEFSGKLDEAGVGYILDQATNALRATGVRFRQTGSAERADLGGTHETNQPKDNGQ